MMSLNLTFREQGSGAPLLILHGLFGSGANWGVVAKALAEDWHVYSLDLRNHGRSPHAEEMGYESMADDVLQFLETQELPKVAILGHSMGGKTAMTLSLLAPERVAALIAVDIAPVVYDHDRLQFADAMLDLDLSRYQSREAVDGALEEAVPNDRARSFLLTNLQRQSDGGFDWRLNLPAIVAQMDSLLGFPEFDAWSRFSGPALFFGGERSDFLAPSTHEAVRHFFPAAQIRQISAAGHNPHIDRPERVIQVLREFLTEVWMEAKAQ